MISQLSSCAAFLIMVSRHYHTRLLWGMRYAWGDWLAKRSEHCRYMALPTSWHQLNSPSICGQLPKLQGSSWSSRSKGRHPTLCTMAKMQMGIAVPFITLATAQHAHVLKELVMAVRGLGNCFKCDGCRGLPQSPRLPSAITYFLTT